LHPDTEKSHTTNQKIKVMKKVNVLLMFMMLSITAMYAADKVIKLLKPNTERSGALMKALSERKSTREYAVTPLSNADLSDLLWAANGINRPSENKRTAPSAMNRQDVDIYVIFPEGAYFYDAKAHKLDLISEGDYRSAVAGGQNSVANAPVSIVLVSELSRLGDAKATRTQVIGAMDAGIVSQNISLFCAAANLATIPRITMDTAKLKSGLKLNDTQIPMINHPVGYFK
jgi:SagB-type dehydrogenase family enzyme